MAGLFILIVGIGIDHIYPCPELGGILRNRAGYGGTPKLIYGHYSQLKMKHKTNILVSTKNAANYQPVGLAT